MRNSRALCIDRSKRLLKISVILPYCHRCHACSEKTTVWNIYNILWTQFRDSSQHKFLYYALFSAEFFCSSNFIVAFLTIFQAVPYYLGKELHLFYFYIYIKTFRATNRVLTDRVKYKPDIQIKYRTTHKVWKNVYLLKT